VPLAKEITQELNQMKIKLKQNAQGRKDDKYKNEW
jgi:hypothetical protein